METSHAPMGWNSWDCYGAAVTEAIVLQNAAYMAEHLMPFGYEYIVVDIQWSDPTAASNDYHPFTELTMDEYSRLLPAVNRFPSAADGKGFAPIAENAATVIGDCGVLMIRLLQSAMLWISLLEVM